MTKKEFILKVLYENGNLTGHKITDFYYEQQEYDVEQKRIYYISKGTEKTEKQLKLQIRAELTAEVAKIWNINLKYISRDNNSPVIYSITEEGKRYYEETYLENTTDSIIVDQENNKNEIIEDESIEDEITTIGIVYLLRSLTYRDTYKIGKTIRTIEERVEDLKRDSTYSIFNLKPIMYIICSDYDLIERVFHKFFENYRLCRRNTMLRDTELFKDLDSIETEFELFANFLKSNPRYKNIQLIKL